MPAGMEFPTDGGGELRAVGKGTNWIQISSSFEKAERLDEDSSDMIEATVSVTDNRGKVWRAKNVIHPDTLLSNAMPDRIFAKEHRLTNRPMGPSLKNTYAVFETTILVEDALLYTPSSNRRYMFVTERLDTTTGDLFDFRVYAGIVQGDHFAAKVDLVLVDTAVRAESIRRSRLWLRVESQVDAIMTALVERAEQPQRNASLLDLCPLSGQLDDERFLLFQQSELIDEDGIQRWTAAWDPQPLMFSPTAETADPCEELAHEPD